MKQLLASLGATLLLLAACNGGSDEPAPASPAPAPTQEQAAVPGIELLAGDVRGGGHLDGPRATALFGPPVAMASDAAGNIYVAQQSVIRRIGTDGMVTTVAGSPGEPGLVDGPRAQARIEPKALLVAPDGTIHFTQGSVVRQIAADGTVSTWAGVPQSPGQLDGPLPAARFARLGAITRDPAGNFYVVDEFTIRRISAGGLVTTLAGRPGFETGYRDGVGAAALLEPGGIAADADGTVYFVQTSTPLIRKVAPDGTVSTVTNSFRTHSNGEFPFRNPKDLVLAPSGEMYVTDQWMIRRVTRDGTVTLLLPQDPPIGSPEYGGIARDPQGNLYVGRARNVGNVILQVTPTGTATTWAGSETAFAVEDSTGAGPIFSFPGAIAANAQGHAFVLDSSGRTVRRITPDGRVMTLAGSAFEFGYADAPTWQARFLNATGIATDAAGFSYVADPGNQAIRKVSPEGMVTTLAGAPGAENRGDRDGDIAQARFTRPVAIAIDDQETMYVLDSGTQSIRAISRGGTVSTVARMANQAQPLSPCAASGCVDPLLDVFVGGTRKVYVTTTRGGLGRVDDGGIVTPIRTPGVEQVWWYAADTAGNLYGADRTTPTLLKRLSASGELVTVAGMPGSIGIRTGALPGSLAGIRDIAVIPAGAAARLQSLLVISGNAILRITLPQ